ncbi:DUF6338 family protein [Rhodococcus wratislaviensis]|uniref:DUF6338 family protein n=1 Tax=Rhodococcus wratislaviensis TaxID=44752 RepID=UPI000F587F81|nr:DUF6338 family protein [Rhodococcus wratislaviensis]
MIGTFQALFVILLAVLPGGLYTIAREHKGAAWSHENATSQLLRFVGVSAAFHVILAPLSYLAYRQLLASGALREGAAISWWWWLVLLAYLVLPYALGEVTARSRSWGPNAGRARTMTRRIVGLYTAESPEPRAWDALFSRPGLTGWVRLKLTDGSWKAGVWSGAYASGYPEEQDLYMPDQAVLDTSGKFVEDRNGDPQLTGWGILIRWSEVQYLEILHSEDEEDITQ